MKQIKLMAVALLLVVLVAMPVFAGQVVTGGTTVAYEVLGSARNISLTGTRPVGLTLGNTLQTGTVLTMNLSNGALFTPSKTYYLCANNTTQVSPTDVIRIADGAAAATNTVLPLAVNVASGANVAVGQAIWLTSNSTCDYAAGSFNFVIATGASVGPTALSGNVILPGTSILMDSFAANNVAVISRQYTTNLIAGQIVAIDFIAGAANGSTLVADLVSTNVIGGSHSLNVISGTPTYSVPFFGGSFNQVLTLTDSHGDWAGLSAVFVVNGTACTGAAAANINVPASGTITLHYPNAANLATGSNTTLCINVAGNVTLPSRTISASYAYEAVSTTSSSALNLPASGGSSVWQTWTPNGYQAFNPYMYVGTNQANMDVFCRFYNSSSRSAQVFVDVYPADGSAAARYTLASIPSNTAGTYWGSAIGALAGLAPDTSYAALFTITATPNQVNGVSFFKRSTGERQLPLYKKVGSLGQYLTE